MCLCVMHHWLHNLLSVDAHVHMHTNGTMHVTIVHTRAHAYAHACKTHAYVADVDADIWHRLQILKKMAAAFLALSCTEQGARARPARAGKTYSQRPLSTRFVLFSVVGCVRRAYSLFLLGMGERVRSRALTMPRCADDPCC